MTDDGLEVFIWSADTGMLSLRQLLADSGAANLEGWPLREETGVSGSGRVIVGWGINPSGDTEAWVAVAPVPEASSLLLL